MRCRQLARAKFAAMRNDALVKMELLDQKHGIVGTNECALCFYVISPFLPFLVFPYLLYRVVLRCRQTARAKFAHMRSDSLVKLELLDNKHGISEKYYIIKCKLIQSSHQHWKNGRPFSNQEILIRPEKSGNFSQSTGKVWKSD